MQMSPFLISQGSNYGYNLVDGFQSAFSQIIDFFFFFLHYTSLSSVGKTKSKSLE